MAHSNQARKRIRQNAARRLHNRTVRSDLRTAAKAFLRLVKDGKLDEAAKQVVVCESKIDKAAKRNIVKDGMASRLKGRLKQRLTRAAQTAKAS